MSLTCIAQSKRKLDNLAVNPVQRVGGFRIAVAAGRAEVRHNAVGAVVRDNFVHAL